MRVSLVPMVKTSTEFGGADQRVGKGEVRLRALLHRAGDVDENDNAALPQTALALTEADNFAGVTHGVAEHAPRVGGGSAARRAPAIAASPRRHEREVRGKSDGVFHLPVRERNGAPRDAPRS